jgi:hypothetical protein
MTMIEESQESPSEGEPGSARALVAQLAEAGLLNRVMKGAEAGELALTGEGGFLPDITGARRGLEGAEAVLTLRAMISNGDFGELALPSSPRTPAALSRHGAGPVRPRRRPAILSQVPCRRNADQGQENLTETRRVAMARR